jgi:Zn-dependent protease
MFNSLTSSNIVVLLVSLVISMTVHEFMHGYVGHLLGDTTAEDEGRLTLNPLKHIDPLMTIVLPIVTILIFKFPVLAAKPVPFNPARLKYGEYGAALLAAAGPFSNLILAIIGVLILKNVALSQFMGSALWTFIGLNVVLFVFNLVPIPPLDGSRILYAFAPEPVQEFMQSIEPFGFFIVISLVLVGGFNILTNIYNDVLTLILRI